jgi:hypothetical protein
MTIRAHPPIIGEQFGRWVVIGPLVITDRVLCRCACGTERQVLARNLRAQVSQSCGCWKQEQMRTIVSETRWKDSHGHVTGGPDYLYRLWQNIKNRCYNPKAHNYKYYGGRGIGVAPEWRHDPEAFCSYIEQTLGPRPPGKSIDRIDNDGDYRPGNVRWATHSEQMANRRASRL